MLSGQQDASPSAARSSIPSDPATREPLATGIDAEIADVVGSQEEFNTFD
jgi:hypothetical protein